jgi:hypothetical protein
MNPTSAPAATISDIVEGDQVETLAAGWVTVTRRVDLLPTTGRRSIRLYLRQPATGATFELTDGYDGLINRR